MTENVLPLRRPPTSDGPEAYVGRTEIAELMGVSERSIDRWCGEGMPHRTWGMRTKKFKPSEVERWAIIREREYDR